ncbi:type II toxin-antitoxin system VapC family toxin [Wielerella bovis]|uniref:type II toxin-antitoxin system VapC family toxin n=1 Tax=Wielerella bovis TaxID=2917790 RepID=UPI00201A0203|nr:type II toxin-antitoxin system VapC family toxin [Wielerella bovis]ULJ61940.1 type II toxin-antitoxin system VapC family toxin [Wielerella bovis]
MKYLLDTNIIIAFQKQHQGLLAQMKKHSVNDFALSNIVLFELAFGAYNSQKVDENLHKLSQLRFPTLTFNSQDAYHAGKIRANLQKQGTPIGAYDTLIAGQAIAQNLILISHNVKEFERIEGLKFENWLV